MTVGDFPDASVSSRGAERQRMTTVETKFFSGLGRLLLDTAVEHAAVEARRTSGWTSWPRTPPSPGERTTLFETAPSQVRVPPYGEGPTVRILLPPAVSLSHQCLSWLQAQRPGFRRECKRD
jgi:hypothetical protein